MNILQSRLAIWIAALLVAASGARAIAHDFWLAAPPRVSQDRRVTLTANVGDDTFPRSQFATAPERVESLTIVGPAGRDQVHPDLQVEGAALQARVVWPAAPGAYVAVIVVKGKLINIVV